MSPFSAPFFWGTQKRGVLLPKRAAALWEGTQWCKGGTGKAEAAKLQDAGISLTQSMSRETSSPRLGADRIFLSAFSLTDRACTHDLRVVFLRRPMRFVAGSGEIFFPCGSISRW